MSRLRPRQVFEATGVRCTGFGRSVRQSHELIHGSKRLCGVALSKSWSALMRQST
jgi:hypothetical protein